MWLGQSATDTQLNLLQQVSHKQQTINMWQSIRLLQLWLALIFILISPPPLCQACLTRLKMCPKHNHGFYLTDFVQSHVERLRKMAITVAYDEFTETSFSMRFVGLGVNDDCVYVKTFGEGGFARFSCKTKFPAVMLEFHRDNSEFLDKICMETMEFYLRNVSANTEVNVIFESGKINAVHIAKLNFYDLYSRLAKKAAEIKPISIWKTAVISKVQALSGWAYLRHNAPRCYV
ncbi:hypothetical protein SprV_0702387000 [Sparganum proliferum]